jgi:PPP family 3-phenylpropionic acid transporter
MAADASVAKRDLLWIKTLRFVEGLASVGWGRYQGVYLNELGQSMSSNGALRAAGLLAKLFCTPLWGAMGDVIDPVTLISVSVISICTLFDLYRWPSVMGRFTWLVGLKISRSALNGVGTLTDILTVRVIERSGDSYGSQRLWGSLATGLGSWLLGSLIDAHGFDAMFNWTYAWYLVLVILLFVFKPRNLGKVDIGKENDAIMLVKNGTSHNHKHGEKSPLKLLASFARLVLDSHSKASPFRAFLLMMLLLGTTMNLVESFMYVSMRREYGCSSAFIGRASMVAVVSNLPYFYFSGAIIRRWGHGRIFAFVHCVLVARLLVMALFVTQETYSWMLLCVQLSHGICFALFWSTAVDFSSKHSPREFKGTSQSITSTVYWILGPGIASVMWSSLYEFIGSRGCYLLGAFAVTVIGPLILSSLMPMNRMSKIAAVLTINKSWIV